MHLLLAASDGTTIGVGAAAVTLIVAGVQMLISRQNAKSQKLIEDAKAANAAIVEKAKADADERANRAESESTERRIMAEMAVEASKSNAAAIAELKGQRSVDHEEILRLRDDRHRIMSVANALYAQVHLYRKMLIAAYEKLGMSKAEIDAQMPDEIDIGELLKAPGDSPRMMPNAMDRR